MSIKLPAFQILLGFWLVNNVQNESGGQTSAKSFSDEFKEYIEQQNLSLTPGSSIHDVFKNIFHNARILEDQNRILVDQKRDLENDKACLKKELNFWQKEFQEQSKFMPHVYFICAMNFILTRGTEIFKNIAGVRYLVLCTPLKPWPPRIQKLRREKDEYDEEKPGRMYLKRLGQKRKKSDFESYNKWFTYVTENPIFLSFHKDGKNISDDEWKNLTRKWRTVAFHLQGNLTQYYNRLDPKIRKERYDDDLRNFLHTFSAVIQRGHRLSCYFLDSMHSKILAELNNVYPNGTRVFLETAFGNVEPNWYFSMEHIDMFNVLINATHNEPVGEEIDYMFPALKIRLSEEDDGFILPGKKDCWKASISVLATPLK
ncbi:uncharacterized protein LOC135847431 [Planococcus citri]|uniref:uncharacterized protein LOC135847431 n=1 Tax=Planococcus citri TaxID=170843 RepID=UPI0031F9462E